MPHKQKAYVDLKRKVGHANDMYNWTVQRSMGLKENPTSHKYMVTLVFTGTIKGEVQADSEEDAIQELGMSLEEHINKTNAWSIEDYDFDDDDSEAYKTV